MVEVAALLDGRITVRAIRRHHAHDQLRVIVSTLGDLVGQIDDAIVAHFNPTFDGHRQ